MKINIVLTVALALFGISNAVRHGPIVGAPKIDRVRHPQRTSSIVKSQDIPEAKHHRYENIDQNDRARVHWKHLHDTEASAGHRQLLPNKSFRHEVARPFLPRYQHRKIWEKRNRRDRRELGRSGGVSWAEWGSCNATCGVGYERRDGRCNFGRCLSERPVEWRGCVGIKCPKKKSHATTIVVCAVALCVGFFGGVFITALICQRKWILEKLKKSKTRRSGKTRLKSTQKKDANRLRPPAPNPRKDIEPSYIDVRELNTIKQTSPDDLVDDGWREEDVCHEDEAGYLIPDGGNLEGYHDYMQPASEPEYIDIVE